MPAHEPSLGFPALPRGEVGRQFGQYLIVGGLAFAVDYGTLFLLSRQAGLHYLVGASLGFGLGLLANYLLCIGWVFDCRTVANRAHEFGIFALIGVAGLGVNNGIMFAATDWGGLHYMVSKLVAAAGVLVFNFVLRRHFLFSEPGIP